LKHPVRLLAISLSIVPLIGLATKAEATGSPPTDISVFTSITQPTSPVMHPELVAQLRSKKGGSIAFWEAVSWCETNHDWDDGGYYSGGLGMAQSVWVNYGGKQFASRPSKATKQEQIIIANRTAFFGFQTKNVFRTLEDRENNKPFFRPAQGWKSMTKWGKGCVDWQARKPSRDRYTEKGIAEWKKSRSSSGRVSAQSAKTEKSCPKYEALLKQHGLPVKDFSYIMWRESRCQAKAVGWNYKSGMSHRDCKLAPAKEYRKCGAVRSYDVGLLQINSSWKTVTAQVCKAPFGKMLVLQKPDCNLKVARYLYDNGGMHHWKGTSGKK
jgi:hypothetical protein